jgi:Holliday junction DNA helicase RuvA
MISKLRGKIDVVEQDRLILSVDGLSYEILVPLSILESFLDKEKTDIELVTLHYYQMEGTKLIPILIGFRNEIEKEFFEKFISVSGIGPKTAVRALTLPIPKIALAIDKADEKLLSKLPGIGKQKARQIIAKLQGKIAKFALIREEEKGIQLSTNAKEEAIEVLLQLQYKKKEAEEMVDSVLKRNPSLTSCEEILNEIYKQRVKTD